MYASIYDVTHQYSAYCYVQLLYIYGRDGAVAKDRSYIPLHCKKKHNSSKQASSRTVPIEEEECKNRMNTHAATNTPQHRSIRSRCTRTWEVSDLTVGVSPAPDRAASSRSRSRPPPSSFTHAMQASIFLPGSLSFFFFFFSRSLLYIRYLLLGSPATTKLLSFRQRDLLVSRLQAGTKSV